MVKMQITHCRKKNYLFKDSLIIKLEFVKGKSIILLNNLKVFLLR